jgi:hypothetical protein
MLTSRYLASFTTDLIINCRKGAAIQGTPIIVRNKRIKTEPVSVLIDFGREEVS